MNIIIFLIVVYAGMRYFMRQPAGRDIDLVTTIAGHKIDNGATQRHKNAILILSTRIIGDEVGRSLFRIRQSADKVRLLTSPFARDEALRILDHLADYAEMHAADHDAARTQEEQDEIARLPDAALDTIADALEDAIFAEGAREPVRILETL